MNVHVLQHAAFEGIGSIALWLEAHAANVSCTRFFEDPTLPELDGLDLIIVMGGPMSVNDESAVSWLRPEKQFVHDAVKRGIPVLGICLGAQLIANALGARVCQNSQKEIGWFPVEGIPGSRNAFRFPEKCMVFHWHGETFDLPSGAVRLARSVVCENQAFQLGRHVIGLQFHLETTPESARAMVKHCSDELLPGPYVQSASQLHAVPNAAYAEMNILMDGVLDYLTGFSQNGSGRS